MSKQADCLDIAILHRLGEIGKQERCSVDFLVNGRSLYALTGAGARDMCGRFSRETPEQNAGAEKVFSLAAPPDMEGGRVMLFVCPECGDIACGAVTLRISRKGDRVTWADFACEDNLEPTTMDSEPCRSIGPYTFTWEKYVEVLKRAARI